MFFQQLFDKIFFSLQFIASNSESNTTTLWGPYKCLPPPDRRDRFSDMPRYGTAHHATKKQAENETIYSQCLNRLNGKDAAVLGKQVLMFNEKKI